MNMFFTSFLFFFPFSSLFIFYLFFTGKVSMSNQQTNGCDIDINCASIAFPLSSHPRGGALFYSTVPQWGFNHFRFLRDLIVESESWNAISWSLWGSLALDAVFSSSWGQRFVHLVSFQACLVGSQCLGGLVGYARNWRGRLCSFLNLLAISYLGLYLFLFCTFVSSSNWQDSFGWLASWNFMKLVLWNMIQQ